ncbi:MAG: transketolase [Candidatus Lloydbacteria bacterium RIFCSPLOWO2_01_FULL_50_20]|uniref:Transketolase n=1 Tax=Candidatus Lloydbacteria bacterium RIFCSPLOWO2_01_FULL_50_20 TaxID=1798665 RepID=A0A1G2DHE7_9BACT|nr:MAG: transketolase [Candidatus Lloydbacteria bacterium RIFCSPHIGHO2_02_FULL_50_11]OGZ12228.1 MAG: transketolase [Candidatus Lloydbacteria bacterium RIFCSPLOWO2_01_FULL_50_20]
MNIVPLNPKLFDKDVEQAPIRQGFGDGLLEAGEQDSRVVALCADLTESTTIHIFKKRFPERYVQVGISEQSMASVASGMAAMGKIPFFSSYAMFSPGRNWEQIRTTICYNHVNAKVIGSHAGISVGPDGGTHQAIEDIAITRVIPRMVVIAPCDKIEAQKATLAAAKYDGPVYIRLAREGTPIVTTAETPFAIGKAEIFFAPKEDVPLQVGIIATGSLVHNAIMAAKELETAGIGAKVLNLPTIKPLDEEAVRSLAKECRAIVTVEEHQRKGGMGSAVAEFLAQTLPTKQEFIGVDDHFGQSGTPNELVEYYGMGTKAIVEAAKKVIAR